LRHTHQKKKWGKNPGSPLGPLKWPFPPLKRKIGKHFSPDKKGPKYKFERGSPKNLKGSKRPKL